MMIFPYIVAGSTVALSAATVALQTKKKFAAKFVVKSIASLGFLVLALVAFFYVSPVQKWHILLAIGMSLGMLGDIFLAVKGVAKENVIEPMLLIGLLFFLIGHLVYIAVFIVLASTFNYYTIFAGVFGPAVIITLLKTKKLTAGRASLPIVIYSFVIGSMLMLALNYSIDCGFSTRGVLILSAALLFTLSDLLLAVYNFGIPKLKGSDIVSCIYMPAYYIAQCLFALAIIF